MRKKAWLFIVGVFLLLISYVIYFDYTRAVRRKNDFAFAKGKIVSFNVDGVYNNSVDITYRVKIDGTELTRNKQVRCEKIVGAMTFFRFINGGIDVVYEKHNPDNCDLLLRKNDYKEYKLTPSKEAVYMIDILEAACGKIE